MDIPNGISVMTESYIMMDRFITIEAIFDAKPKPKPTPVPAAKTVVSPSPAAKPLVGPRPTPFPRPSPAQLNEKGKRNSRSTLSDKELIEKIKGLIITESQNFNKSYNSNRILQGVDDEMILLLKEVNTRIYKPQVKGVEPIDIKNVVHYILTHKGGEVFQEYSKIPDTNTAIKQKFFERYQLYLKWLRMVP